LLGKKIQAAEMKLVVLYIVAMPLAALTFAGASVLLATALAGRANTGPHGLTEMMYAFTSASNNNGSAFGGLTVTSNWYQTTLGLCMLIGRFFLIIPTLAIAGSLVRKQKVPSTTGTFPTDTPLFGGLVLGVVLIVAGLTFFPVLALGPIVEHLGL
jgi:K+-transporting ATPase ATPase A chain